MAPLRKAWNHYGLSITLAAMFLASWLAHFLVQMREFSNEQEEHGQAFQWGEFMPAFWTSTLENWQSEFLQLFTFVVLSSFLSHRGSPESKDSEEKNEGREIEMLRRLDRLEKLLTERAPAPQESSRRK
jgi:hypothetical protein